MLSQSLAERLTFSYIQVILIFFSFAVTFWSCETAACVFLSEMLIGTQRVFGLDNGLPIGDTEGLSTFFQ